MNPKEPRPETATTSKSATSSEMVGATGFAPTSCGKVGKGNYARCGVRLESGVTWYCDQCTGRGERIRPDVTPRGDAAALTPPSDAEQDGVLFLGAAQRNRGRADVLESTAAYVHERAGTGRRSHAAKKLAGAMHELALAHLEYADALEGYQLAGVRFEPPCSDPGCLCNSGVAS